MNTISVLVSIMIMFYPSNEKVMTETVVEAISDTYPTWSQEYQRSVFDCTEMSAFVSYCLDNAGVENKIVMGFDGIYYHAWVETKDYKIECTTLTMYGDRTIYYQEAPKWNYTMYSVTDYQTPWYDWDWWNSPIFTQNSKLNVKE